MTRPDARTAIVFAGRGTPSNTAPANGERAVSDIIATRKYLFLLATQLSGPFWTRAAVESSFEKSMLSGSSRIVFTTNARCRSSSAESASDDRNQEGSETTSTRGAPEAAVERTDPLTRTR